MELTEKQINRIQKIQEHLGNDRVENYFYKHFPNGDIKNMTRKQAQKVITGLGSYLPTKPMHGVKTSWGYID